MESQTQNPEFMNNPENFNKGVGPTALMCRLVRAFVVSIQLNEFSSKEAHIVLLMVCLTLCRLGNFSYFCCCLLTFIKINFF